MTFYIIASAIIITVMFIVSIRRFTIYYLPCLMATTLLTIRLILLSTGLLAESVASGYHASEVFNVLVSKVLAWGIFILYLISLLSFIIGKVVMCIFRNSEKHAGKWWAPKAKPLTAGVVLFAMSYAVWFLFIMGCLMPHVLHAGTDVKGGNGQIKMVGEGDIFLCSMRIYHGRDGDIMWRPLCLVYSDTYETHWRDLPLSCQISGDELILLNDKTGQEIGRCSLNQPNPSEPQQFIFKTRGDNPDTAPDTTPASSPTTNATPSR